jgi:hypothetical protein
MRGEGGVIKCVWDEGVKNSQVQLFSWVEFSFFSQINVLGPSGQSTETG